MSAFEDLEYYLRHEFLHAGGGVGPGATALTVSVNLKGTFNGLREAAKRLRNGGRIKRFHLMAPKSVPQVMMQLSDCGRL